MTRLAKIGQISGLGPQILLGLACGDLAVDEVPHASQSHDHQELLHDREHTAGAAAGAKRARPVVHEHVYSSWATPVREFLL